MSTIPKKDIDHPEKVQRELSALYHCHMKSVLRPYSLLHLRSGGWKETSLKCISWLPEKRTYTTPIFFSWTILDIAPVVTDSNWNLKSKVHVWIFEYFFSNRIVSHLNSLGPTVARRWSWVSVLLTFKKRWSGSMYATSGAFKAETFKPDINK